MIETRNLRVFRAGEELLAALQRGGTAGLSAVMQCPVADGLPVFPEGVDYWLANGIPEMPFGPWWGLDRASGTFVVEGGMHRTGPASLEFGYAVAPAWRRRGIATEFARALLEQGFAVPDIAEIQAHTMPPGTVSPEGFPAEPSIALLKRLGFNGHSAGEVWDWNLQRPAATAHPA